MEGITRFLERVWRLMVTEEGGLSPSVAASAPGLEQQRLLHQTIKKVTEDIEELHFNTAIAQMMVFRNEMTKARYSAANPSVASRGASYGMPGIELDGNDVVAIHAAADQAIRRARSGGGPSLLECKTYRTRPHAEGMGDFSYRTREEVDHWKTLDPIPRLKQHLLAHQMATEADFAVIEADVAALVAEAQQFAFKLQNADGSWHPQFFAARGPSRDNAGMFRSTAYIAEWLAMAASDEELGDPRLARSIDYLAAGLNQRSRAVLCTHKDLVKLNIAQLGDIPLWALTIELEITAGRDEFERELGKLIAPGRGPEPQPA